MSLADYLAKNYLTADPTPKKSKKRKRKDASRPSTGLVIADDDALGWDPHKPTGTSDDEAPVTGPSATLPLPFPKPPNTTHPVTGQTSSFRPTKTSTWRTIGAPPPTSTDQATADSILTAAAADRALLASSDEAPTITNPDPEPETAKMESGAHAGLQSASQVTAQLARRQVEELSRFRADAATHTGQGSETIYRDASGRIINVAMKRAEARAAAEKEAAAAAAEVESRKGAVQLARAAERKQELEEARLMPVARYADDEKLNEEMRARERWEDPASGFVTRGKEGKSVSGKPLYKGPAGGPNRYGIRPGYRWDGVDRGNGFEREWFASRNRRANVRDLEYAWQMDE
ncbi:Pre-mRNA-splicing factor cwc26 [Loxospora ochrophaea]|nr:Pre-mRNA-splicing factor cwc26 [Loxospora ochrophaea]